MEFSFFDAKDFGEIPTGSPPTGTQIEVGYVQICDFRSTSRYISGTVQDMDIVTIQKANRNYALYLMVLFPLTLNDP